MTQIKTLKKITLKDIGLPIPVGGGDYLGKTVALVSGKANGYFMKPGQYGESIGFTGDFVAINTITNEVFESSTIYLPQEYSQTVEKKLEGSEPGAEAVFENLEIVVSPSAKAARGYTFIVRALHTLELVNKKKELASKMMHQLTALPAPEKEETKKVDSKKKSA